MGGTRPKVLRRLPLRWRPALAYAATGSGRRQAWRSAFAVAAAILLSSSAAGQTLAGKLVWVRQFGSQSDDAAYALATDASGIYVAGDTRGSLGGQVNVGDMDAFVVKYDANGTVLWTREFGTTSFDNAFAIATDASGVYVAGDTYGALPGQTALGGYDAFVMKYSRGGALLWTRQFGTGSDDMAYALSANSSGVYVAGSTDGILPDRTIGYGLQDAFVAKYDANGTRIWTRQFGTPLFDRADAVVADASGVYVAGYSGSNINDAFITKYGTNGTLIWMHQFGTPQDDAARALAADASGVYVAGYTFDTLPGQTYFGLQDAFVAKYDANGTLIWTRQFGTTSYDSADALTLGPSGVYVAGSTDGALPGQTSTSQGDAYVSNAFVAEYDGNGSVVWVAQFGSSKGDGAEALAAHGQTVYVAGWVQAALTGQTSAGGEDSFIAQVGQIIASGPQPSLEIWIELALVGIAATAVAVVFNRWRRHQKPGR